MPRPSSVDLRERVLAAVTDGWSRAEVAQRFSVSERTVTRWVGSHAATGSLAPRIGPSGRPRALSGVTETALRARIVAVPDATIDELRG